MQLPIEFELKKEKLEMQKNTIETAKLFQSPKCALLKMQQFENKVREKQAEKEIADMELVERKMGPLNTLRSLVRDAHWKLVDYAELGDWGDYWSTMMLMKSVRDAPKGWVEMMQELIDERSESADQKEKIKKSITTYGCEETVEELQSKLQHKAQEKSGAQLIKLRKLVTTKKSTTTNSGTGTVNAPAPAAPAQAPAAPVAAAAEETATTTASDTKEQADAEAEPKAETKGDEADK